MTSRATILVALLAVAALLAGCPDDGDETAAVGDEQAVDAGADVDEQIPSVESINFDDAQPAAAAQRIHVESSRQRGVISATPNLPAKEFLSLDEARAFLGEAELEALPLAGQSSSTNHNSVRYAPREVEGQSLGLTLQVWDLSDAEFSTSERLTNLRDQFLNVADVDHDDAPDGAFTSERSGIRSLIFAGQSTPHIFVLSCDIESCANWDDLVELGISLASQY